MITINGYPGVDDEVKLEGAAKAVLENYRRHRGRILNSRSVPPTADHPPEHFIAVMFTRPQFVEIAFARFKLMEGQGHSFVYSHRGYGERAKDEMDSWFAANRADVEKALMEWNPPPSLTAGH